MSQKERGREKDERAGKRVNPLSLIRFEQLLGLPGKESHPLVFSAGNHLASAAAPGLTPLLCRTLPQSTYHSRDGFLGKERQFCPVLYFALERLCRCGAYVDAFPKVRTGNFCQQSFLSASGHGSPAQLKLSNAHLLSLCDRTMRTCVKKAGGWPFPAILVLQNCCVY